MSSPKWTKEQQKVIDNRNSDLLVSAAAGSGKTAVLVERIIQMITDKDNPIDIDKLLVVTFTNAAASEMRERIGDAIVKALDKNPDNKFLQNQILLLNRASITTIHSFCLDVIKSNFHIIDIDPNFRIGDDTECNLLRREALEEVFDELYDEEDEGFLNLVETYAEKGGDKAVQDMLLQIYLFAMSSPNPNKWIKDSAEMFNIDESFDFSDSVWAKYILESVKIELEGIVSDMKNALSLVEGIEELETFKDKMETEYRSIKNALNSCKASWYEAYDNIYNFEFENYVKGVKRIPKDSPEYVTVRKNKAKKIRDKAKDSINKIKETSFNKDNEAIYYELSLLYRIMKPISDLVLKFESSYSEKKREKSIIDFNDIEHFALDILTYKDEEGNLNPSEIAKKYQDSFYEIFVDEYQDSNLVQEVLLKSVSKEDKPNRFMVGDVKQSIYRFRQARPELFLEKYRTYSTEKGSDHRKIMLYKNFRSRDEVINSINYIFENIMSRDIGEIEYTDEERLNLGADFKECSDENSKTGGATEIHLIEKNSSTKNAEFGDTEVTYSYEDHSKDFEDQEDLEELDKIQIEARMAGKIIKKLMNPDEDGKYQMVFDKSIGDYRRVDFKDIVILLRATSAWAPVFADELMNMDIPTFADTGIGYFESIEIKTVISLLQIIDNPIQDIPLIAVLKSPIFGLTPVDLVNIRISSREGNFYYALKNLASMDLDIENREEFISTIDKSNRFLDKLDEYREKSMYMSTYEFLWFIYNDTGYYSYVGAMPGGIQRQANLKTLFERAKQYEETSYKGIFNFINFIDKLKKSSGDMGSAKTLGENANVVRIMSIHKSKGLEFPIVICSGLGKNFNMQDFRKNVLYHQDLGYGPQFIDFERRISFPSIAKETLKKKMTMESLSEEMRVLYVALTRAKEKLILTGSVRSIEKCMDKWSANIDEKGDISKFGIFKGRSYLDWIMPVAMKHRDLSNIRENFDVDIPVESDESIWSAKIWNRDELAIRSNEMDGDQSIGSILKSLNCDEYSSGYGEEIENTLDSEYKYNLSTVTPSGISVTEIKKMQEVQEDGMYENIYKQNEFEVSLKKPLFIQDSDEKKDIGGAERGTIIHLFMQLVDYGRVNSIDQIKDQISELVEKKFIKENHAEVINPFKIYKFFKSDIGKRVRRSDFVSRERAIDYSMPMEEVFTGESVSNRISENEEIFEVENIGKIESENITKNTEVYTNELIKIKGIVDLYFEENEEIVLVDYKTDFVNEENFIEVKNRYNKQVEFYAKALEDLTGKKVKEKWVYLFGLDRAVLYE